MVGATWISPAARCKFPFLMPSMIGKSSTNICDDPIYHHSLSLAIVDPAQNVFHSRRYITEFTLEELYRSVDYRRGVGVMI